MPVTSHRGEYIAKALENYLLDWGIKYVFCITIDNTLSNDTAVGYLKKITQLGCIFYYVEVFAYEMHSTCL